MTAVQPPFAAYLALLLLVAVPGAAQVRDAPRPPGTVTAFSVRAPADATDAQVADAAAILARRFRQVLRSITASVTPTIRNRRIEIRIRGDAVTPAEARYLGASRGVLHVALASAPLQTWISDLDIQKVVAFNDGRSWVIGIDVRPRAAERLASRSTINAGALIDWTLDGERLTRSRLGAPIPDGRMKLDLESIGHAVLLEVLLKHGRLPVEVSDFQILADTGK